MSLHSPFFTAFVAKAPACEFHYAFDWVKPCFVPLIANNRFTVLDELLASPTLLPMLAQLPIYGMKLIVHGILLCLITQLFGYTVTLVTVVVIEKAPK